MLLLGAVLSIFAVWIIYSRSSEFVSRSADSAESSSVHPVPGDVEPAEKAESIPGENLIMPVTESERNIRDTVYYAIVPAQAAWRKLPLDQRMFTPRSGEDIQWMNEVGYPKLLDVKSAPDYLSFEAIPPEGGVYAINVAIGKKLLSGDPIWREWAKAALPYSPFAARALLEDALEMRMDNRGEQYRRNLERYVATAIMLGDLDAAYAVRETEHNILFQYLNANDLAAIIRSSGVNLQNRSVRVRPTPDGG